MRFLLLLAFILLSGCSRTPDCLVDPEYAESAVANAGCLVRDGSYLLVVEQRSGKLSLPAGINEPGETAQCTAHRETWEEAGLAVEVGELLHAFDNSFRLYACRPVDPGTGRQQALKPAWIAWREIAAVHWIEPADINADDWRYPQQWPQLMEIFSNQP